MYANDDISVVRCGFRRYAVLTFKRRTAMSNGQVLAQLKLMPKADIVIRPDAITAKRIKLLSRLKEQRDVAQCTIEDRAYESTRNKRVVNKETGEASVITVDD